jgi:flagellar biogenesis protein FliO
MMMVILMMVILVIVILLIVTVRRMRVDVGHLANRDPLIELTPSASR